MLARSQGHQSAKAGQVFPLRQGVVADGALNHKKGHSTLGLDLRMILEDPLQLLSYFHQAYLEADGGALEHELDSVGEHGV